MRIVMLAMSIAPIALSPAYSQDLGTLDRHLEHQQSVRVQEHQNRMRAPNGRPANVLARCTEHHVPKADYDRIRARHDQIARAQGKQAAGQWAQEQADAWYERLRRQRVCR